MLAGYDNPDPTPRIPLTGNDFNHRYPQTPIQSVKPFSERILSHILKEEAEDRIPRHESFVAVGDKGIWKKIGNRTFYRLYGLRYIQHSQNKNGIQESINKANSRVFLKDFTYPINSNITPKTGIYVEGETSHGTILQAGANNLKIFSVASTLMTNMRFWHLGLDANAKTGLTGLDLNMSAAEASVNNSVHDIKFINSMSGAFSTLVDMIGNEDSWLDLVYLTNASGQGYGETYAQVHNGQICLSRLIYSSPSGTSAGVHVMGQIVSIQDSVLNTVIIDNQSPGDFNTSGVINIANTYLSNNQPTGVPKIQNGAGTLGRTVFVLALDRCRVGLANSGTFMSNAAAQTFTVTDLDIFGCQFLNLDASAVTWAKNTGGSALTPGKILTWDPGNTVSGTIGNGDVVSGGYGVFNFQVPPAGWGLTQVPAKPTLTGSGNAVRNKFPRPVLIYHVGPVGTHIIDSGPLRDGASGTDTALGVDPPVVQLNRFEQIYYATTVPSAWTWFGL